MTTRTCTTDGCDRPYLARGLCKRCYSREQYRRTHGPVVGPTTCTGPDCDRTALRRGTLCRQHQRQWNKHGQLKPLESRRSLKGLTCAGPECDRPVSTADLCSTHHSQQRRGRPLTPVGQARRVRPTCQFPDCGRPHAAKGWCRPHREQERAGKGMWPIGQKPTKPRPVKPVKPVKVKPLKLPKNVLPIDRKKPDTGLPPGWFKPSRKPLKPTKPTAKSVSQIIDVPPPNPTLQAMARDTLTRWGADDLAAMLGLEEAS